VGATSTTDISATAVMADAVGRDSKNDINSPVYTLCRPGYFTNFTARLGKSRTAGNDVTVSFFAWQGVTLAPSTDSNPITLLLAGAAGNPPKYNFNTSIKGAPGLQ